MKKAAGERFITLDIFRGLTILLMIIVNTLWAGLNIVIGYILFRVGSVLLNDTLNAVVFFAGFMIMAVMLSNNFQKKHKE